MITESINASTQSSLPLNPVGTAGAREAAPKGMDLEEGGKTTLQDIEAVTASLENSFKLIHQVDLQFSLHKASGQLVVTVTDAITGKVIREIPPSELLNLAARLDEMIGLLFDQMG
jgi:uncharacterized FlaG/YvyC family protein